jgi:hypothetical protein
MKYYNDLEKTLSSTNASLFPLAMPQKLTFKTLLLITHIQSSLTTPLILIYWHRLQRKQEWLTESIYRTHMSKEWRGFLYILFSCRNFSFNENCLLKLMRDFYIKRDPKTWKHLKECFCLEENFTLLLGNWSKLLTISWKSIQGCDTQSQATGWKKTDAFQNTDVPNVNLMRGKMLLHELTSRPTATQPSMPLTCGTF